MRFAANKEQGFILVATIWVLAFITLGAAAIAEWYDRTLELASESVVERDYLAAELNTEAVLLYHLTTRTIGAAGVYLEEIEDESPLAPGQLQTVRQDSPDIVFDGQAYAGFDGARFAVQDENGLFGVGIDASLSLVNFLVNRGVEPDEAMVLVSRFADYQDGDDLVRINGAEKGEYRRADLPEPANQLLRTPFELRAVMGWDEHPQLWEDNALANSISVFRSGYPNTRTAPADVLTTIRGLSPETAQAIVQQRRDPESALPREAQQELANALRRVDQAAIARRPSHYIRVRLWHPEARHMREFSVQFATGLRVISPWVIEYNIKLPIPQEYKSETATVQELPLFVL